MLRLKCNVEPRHLSTWLRKAQGLPTAGASCPWARDVEAVNATPGSLHLFAGKTLVFEKCIVCLKKSKIKEKNKIQYWHSSVFLLNFLLNFSQFAAFSLTFSSAKIYWCLLAEQGCGLFSIILTPPTFSLPSCTLLTYACSPRVFLFFSFSLQHAYMLLWLF